MRLKARVRNGRLVLNQPTELPEGTEVDLLCLDPGDWMDPADRAALHATLLESQEDVKAGRLIEGEEVLKSLRLSGREELARLPVLTEPSPTPGVDLDDTSRLWEAE